jgi:predicted CopG family antitoxin
MARKKLPNPEAILSKPIVIRVTEELFNRLEKIQKESDCSSVGEVVRKILGNKRINCFYRDISLNAPMEEMALIRKELKAIGININQQTKYFHTSQGSAERAFYVMKTADLYKMADEKVDRLLIIISKLAERWLSKS